MTFSLSSEMNAVDQAIHLRDEYVGLIRSGQKSIEGRLNRPPYNDVKEGGTVRYSGVATSNLAMRVWLLLTVFVPKRAVNNQN